MQRYKDFSPTSFDSHIEVEDIEDWFIVLGRNRDSDILSESNWATVLEELGDEGDNVEIHRFGHWANGWFEIMLVRPDTKEADMAQEITNALADYPVFDEDDLSRRECEEAGESWENRASDDAWEALENLLDEDNAEDLNEDREAFLKARNLTEDELDLELYRASEWEFHSDGAHFHVDRAADTVLAQYPELNKSPELIRLEKIEAQTKSMFAE